MNLTADLKALEGSWILSLARDPAPLVALATTSDGWRLLLNGDPEAALQRFGQDAKVAGPSARIGAARAALELAQSHALIGRMMLDLTPSAIKAHSTRPGGEGSEDWRRFLTARQAGATGGASPASPPPAAESPAAPWFALLSGDSPAAALLSGKAGGVDATLPEGGTDAYTRRLMAAALVRAGQHEAALRELGRVDWSKPDVAVEEGGGGLRDPVAAGVGGLVYAAIARSHLVDAKGWDRLLDVEALLILGDLDGALAGLDGLAKEKPAPPELPLLLGGDSMDADELSWRAAAHRAVILKRKGDAAAANAVIEGLPNDRVAARVWRAWASAEVGAAVDLESFPSDRSELQRALVDGITTLAREAPGMRDVSELALVERHVDALERRFATALSLADRPELAIKHRESAEDKTASFGPSGRNALPALVESAADNARIGRPRVALKYLTRLNEHLPAATAPADILRDLLSYRAMERGGGATAGQ